ncbi:hypothetical protein B0H15DRAFT_956863 [Mycena belliarum]|uniref:Uncharacterized protein n=1 Tax=Mycena belliarum TaxID=1033014 RepID=A0AAD6TTF5_9AGAR|nr:hypothetical protein B0H15DRAFT_956863 [Mycena belliae]
MEFPPPLNTFDALLSYLETCNPPSLSSSIHGVDFHSPKFTMFTRDESAYTTDDGRPFETMVFGCVETIVVWDREDERRTFRLNGGVAPTAVNKEFRNQLYQLARAVRVDDDRDEAGSDDIEVFPCTDSNRESGAGGRQLIVDVEEVYLKRCTYYQEIQGELKKSVPGDDDEWKLNVGDWVLCKATFHKHEPIWRPFTRTYYLLASELCVITPSEAARLSPCIICKPLMEASDDPSAAANDPPIITPDNGALARLTGVRGTVGQATAVAETSIARTATRSRTQHLLTESRVISSGPSAPPRRTRKRAAETDPLDEEEVESNPIARTPRKKRATARMSTGGRPPKKGDLA